MTDDEKQQAAQANSPAAQNTPPNTCAPGTLVPARQPKQPPSTTGDCKVPDPAPATPAVPAPTACAVPCNCPTKPSSSASCIDLLIDAQTAAIAEAERATKFKADLVALQEKAKNAHAAYTLDKYKALLDIWKAQDEKIAKLIAKLVCAVKDWRLQTECQVCSLFNQIRDLEVRLNGAAGVYFEKVNSLYDLQYWLRRDLVRKQQAFDRVKNTLTAWENPAADIERALNGNAELIRDAEQFLAPDAAKLLYDVFIRLVPMHLAIAPPALIATTKIDQKYTALCGCDMPAKLDDCCGPDVGPTSVQVQLLGPQPYLILPDEYFPLICCLIESRYRHAKEALGKTEGELKKVESDIERVKGEIEARIKSIAADAAVELGKPFQPKPGAATTNVTAENHHA